MTTTSKNRSGEPWCRRLQDLCIVGTVLITANLTLFQWGLLSNLSGFRRLQSIEEYQGPISSTQHQQLLGNRPWYSSPVANLQAPFSSRGNGLSPFESSSSSLSLRPGDLPGYTGWARPTFTLAPWFEAVSVPVQAFVGQTYHATVQCQGHALCWAGKDRASLFDVRAYGPSIVTGPVQEIDASIAVGELTPSVLSPRQYQLSLHFLDPGVYTLEWVVALSAPSIPLDGYPVLDEPAYEGYLLPGFPVTILVLDPTQPFPEASPSLLSSSSSWLRRNVDLEDAVSPRQENGAESVGHLAACQTSDLLDQTFTSALERGRWVVQEKVSSRSFQVSLASQSDQDSKLNESLKDTQSRVIPDSSVSLLGYQIGVNSIGFRMAYMYQTCSLPSLEDLKPAMDSRRRHLIFVGDSNMVRQVHLCTDQSYELVNCTYIKDSGGLINVLPQIQETFAELQKQQEQEKDEVSYHIIFNSGLHDIAHLCTAAYGKLSARLSKTTVEGLPRCAMSYRRLLTELATTIKQFPAQTKVFQTTTAGWPKWGNYGFAWPPNEAQTFPRSPQYAEYFNSIAWEVMEQAGIPIVDAFWKTRARADHREVTDPVEIGKHLVHAGPEIYDLFVREFFHMVVNSDKRA